MWSAENESGQHKQPTEVGPLQIVSLNSLVFRDFLLVIFHFMFPIYSGSVPKTMLFKYLVKVIFILPSSKYPSASLKHYRAIICLI